MLLKRNPHCFRFFKLFRHPFFFKILLFFLLISHTVRKIANSTILTRIATVIPHNLNFVQINISFSVFNVLHIGFEVVFDVPWIVMSRQKIVFIYIQFFLDIFFVLRRLRLFVCMKIILIGINIRQIFKFFVDLLLILNLLDFFFLFGLINGSFMSLMLENKTSFPLTITYIPNTFSFFIIIFGFHSISSFLLILISSKFRFAY